MTSSKRLCRQWNLDRRLVFGHRGAKAYAPMNTLPAFELAWEQGARTGSNWMCIAPKMAIQ